MTAVVTTAHGLAGLLRATDDHPFVRWEVTPDLADTWWRSGDAVAFQRTRKTIRRTVSLLGDDEGVLTLIDALPDLAATVTPGRKVLSVSVPQHLEPRLRERFRVMEGGDGEWFHTPGAPEADPSHALGRPLDDGSRAREVSAFLAAHSPTADTEPGTGERWFAVEEPDGSLAAVAAWGATCAGAPHLSSVAVHTGLRGRGLGRTVVAALTRWAVAEAGVCTLGMYSHNDVGRRLYASLGYTNVCAWASRPVVVAPDPHA